VWEGAKWTGGKIAGGAKAAYRGVRWVGGKLVWLGGVVKDEVIRVGGQVWQCAKIVGRSAVDLLTFSLPPLNELLNIPKPTGDSPIGILDVIVAILKHPCLQMIPGYTLFASAVEKVQDVYNFLKGAWYLIKHPDEIIDGIRKAISPMADMAPERARELAEKAITFSPPPQGHMMGIWRHLEPKLEYMGAHWWEILKQTAWDLLWPWPGVSKDLGEIWDHIKAAASDLWDLEFSTATDHLLAVWRGVNNMLGRLYGWIFIASVLIGAILGAIFGGGVGAIPGAAAGAKFALAFGEGLLISTVAAETISIGKAGIDLVFTKQTDEKKEEDYEQIASSGIVLAIAGVMYLIGAVAARFAKAIIERVAGRAWARPVLRGRGAVTRGDIIELRVTMASRVMGLVERYSVDWLELIRRDFPGIDIAEGSTINVTPRPGRAPLYRVTGGRVISVKSTAQVGTDAVAEIQTRITELQTFSSYKNVSVVNPTGRTRMLAVQTPLDEATAAALRAFAQARGVRLEMFTNFPPNHPALVFPESIPLIMSEAGVVAADDVNQKKGTGQDQPAAKTAPAHP
jgi:hypothetical protein